MSKFFKAFNLVKGKVSPTITKVKPNLKKTVKESRSDEYSKRVKKLRAAQEKVETGKKMMKEGQRERKRMRDTGTAFQFKNKKTWHPLKPGDKKTYKVDKKGIAQ